MSNIDDKLVLDDTQEPYQYDDNQSTNIEVGLVSLTLSPFHECSVSDEEISCQTSEHQNTFTPSDKVKYRIHLGTQPGYYTKDQITFTKSQRFHSQMIDYVEAFLIASKVPYKLIKKDAFSISEWGIEPYACVVLSCSHHVARGTAAIIGLALRQDAIGIFTDNSNDSPHPVFTVTTSDGSLITKTKSMQLMKIVTKNYKCLSSQFDQDGQYIEFHDFQNSNDQQISTHHIEQTINRNLGTNHLFQLKKSSSHSSLLEKQDYEKAIKEADLEPFSTIIKLTRLHDELYDISESTCNTINS